MDTTLVILHHGGKWVQDKEYIDYEVVGIPVPRGCTYTGIQDIVFSALDLDTTKVALTLHYELNKGMPLVKFVNNNSVTFYLELKKINKDIGSFPLIIDTTLISESITCDTSQCIQLQRSDTIQHDDRLQLPLLESENSTTKAEKSIEEIASEVYECIEQKKQVDSEVDNEVQSIIVSETVVATITKNQLFQDKEVLKVSIAKFAMRNMFQFKVKKSDSKEYVLKCIDNNCQWTFRASKVGKTSMFKIRYIKNDHTCTVDTVMGDHRQASSSTIALFIKHKYTSTNTIYTPNDIMNDMLNDYGVSMSYDKSWRARERAYELLMGDPQESYQRLPTYLHMLELANPGSNTRIETDSSNRFKYLFMALGASIQGWEFCRPVIVVDGTHLKGPYRGTLFTACTQDANNNIFILGFGIGDSENNDSWEWFMNRIKETYGEREGLCIVSDRHPSIEIAVEKVYPNVLHGTCSVHLLKNLKSTYGKNVKNVTQPFNAAVRAYTREEFEYQMSQMDKINDKIRGYLEKAGYDKWSRAYMTTNRYSIMTSNIVESVNAVVKAAKKKPVEALMECLRYVLQNWFSKNRENAMATFTILAATQDKILRERTMESTKMKTIPSTPVIYEVKSTSRSNLVNIQERTCTCHKFQIDQIPCAHALAVIRTKHFSAYDYCSTYYTKSSYVDTYKGTIFPLGDRSGWTVPMDVLSREVLPPIPTKKVGRPKEKRIPSKGEHKVTIKCGRCLNYGHDRRTCNYPIPLKKKIKDQC